MPKLRVWRAIGLIYLSRRAYFLAMVDIRRTKEILCDRINLFREHQDASGMTYL